MISVIQMPAARSPPRKETTEALRLFLYLMQGLVSRAPFVQLLYLHSESLQCSQGEMEDPGEV